MLPFSGYGPIDSTERKALLCAALFSCLFIVVLGVARPHRRHTRRLTNEIKVPTPAPYRVNEPDLSSLDSFAKSRIRPEQFDQVDFNYYSYGPYKSSDGTQIDLNLAQGRFYLPDNSSWFELKDVYYTDLTGDGKAEAIVRLSHVTCGGGLCNGGANMFYVYTENKGKLKPIWQYETGSYADGCGLQSFTAGGTEIVLELFSRCQKSAVDDQGLQRFVSKDLTFIIFEFDGHRFKQKSIEILDSPPTITTDYKPGIRIY
jgi:hypothetical protein